MENNTNDDKKLFEEQMSKIHRMIREKKLEEAEESLKNILGKTNRKQIEDENNSYYCFNNYVETIIYWNKYRPIKQNKIPNTNIANVYYLLGYINIEKKNYDIAINYLNEAIKWNPIYVQYQFERAFAYRVKGDLEKYKEETEKTYSLIYTTSHLAKYYRDLGFYYIDKKNYDIANALFTYSVYFEKNENAKNELIYIAKMQNREFKFSNEEEIKKLFLEYNISRNFDKQIVQMINYEYQNLMQKNKTLPVTKYLSRILYNITLDKKFMLYIDLKDEEHRVSISIPETWRFINKNDYEKLNIDKNTTFLLLTPNNQKISIICNGRCSLEQFESQYKLDIENMKKQNIQIIKEIPREHEKIKKQIFIDIKNESKTQRVFQNYLLVNGYIFIASWEIPNNINLEEIYKEISNSFAMDVVSSLRSKNEIINTSKEETDLKVYSQEIEGYPIFKFYLPKDIGEQEKCGNNVFEIKQGKMQKMRIMISKCSSEKELKESARTWIEKTRTANKQEIIEYRKERIKNIPIEVYILENSKQTKRIYKIGYVNGYKITLSSNFISEREEMINKAFETVEVVEANIKNNIQDEKQSIINEINRNIKVAFMSFETGEIEESLNYLDKSVKSLLKDDKTIEKDPFWKILSENVYKAILLDKFYNNNQINIKELYSLLKDTETIKKDISEFCEISRENEKIHFCKSVENVSEKMLEDVVYIIKDNIEKFI